MQDTKFETQQAVFMTRGIEQRGDINDCGVDIFTLHVNEKKRGKHDECIKLI